jgi:3-hydroxybutyrate dehydrogenase
MVDNRYRGYLAAKHGLRGLVKTLAPLRRRRRNPVHGDLPPLRPHLLVEKQIADQAKAHDLPEERVLEDVDRALIATRTTDRSPG